MEISEGTKKLKEFKCYAVITNGDKEDGVYHEVDFVTVIGTKCGYPINQKMALYNHQPPEGKTLCKDCADGNLDWSRRA